MHLKMAKRKKEKQKLNKRNSSKYPSLKPKYNLITRQEEIQDIASYVGKLNEEEKAWMAKFVDEYVNASFGDDPLHKTKEEQRELYNRNNIRNRDIFTKAKASGKLDFMSNYEGILKKKSNGEEEDD